ncbi:MAG: CoA-binding protein [Deltaproteobacteria bacterium]|nr:MAG: CoA-binding protein [Deltaproteobacteria bacterium]
MTTPQSQITTFLKSQAFGVVGASNDRSKFGNRVLRHYLERHLKVYPINPNESQVEGLACLSSVNELPDEVISLSIITPPAVTEEIVEAAIAKGIKNIWMQPGAQSAKAIAVCEKAGVNVIGDGRCVLVEV